MTETMNKVVQTNEPQHKMRKAWLALTNMPIATYTLSTVSKEDNAAASSMFNITKQVMSALSVTIVTNLITSKMTSELKTLMTGVDLSDKAAVTNAQLTATAHAMSYSAEITAAMIVVALVMSFFFRSKKKLAATAKTYA